MARKRRLNENKKNIIASLIEEYDIQTAADVQEALKDLLGGTIQEMMEAELDNHLGYKSYERSDNPDYRNGTKSKTLRSTCCWGRIKRPLGAALSIGVTRITTSSGSIKSPTS